MFTIREADKRDNEGLLRLTRMCPMKGRISLLIDRVPDFFLLPAERGESITLAAIDSAGGSVIGSFTASFFSGFIAGGEEQILYVSDLKVHPDYRNKKVALSLLREMEGRIRKHAPRVVFCVMAEGNAAVFRFFQALSGFPEFVPVGRFHVLQIFPVPGKTAAGITEVQTAGMEEGLVEFYRRYYQALDLAPVLQRRNLARCRSFALMQDNKIRAAISLTDAGPYKQNVIIDMPAYLKVLTAVGRAARHFLPLPYLPGAGEPIRTLFVRAYGCLNGAEDTLRSLLKFSRNLAYREGYSFLSVGLHDRNPVLQLLKGMPAIDFVSHLYVADFKGDKKVTDGMLEQGIPYVDFSTV